MLFDLKRAAGKFEMLMIVIMTSIKMQIAFLNFDNIVILSKTSKTYIDPVKKALTLLQ